MIKRHLTKAAPRPTEAINQHAAPRRGPCGRQRRWPWCAALWSAVFLTGCSPPSRTVPVTGRVTLNGEPVAGAKVVFLSAFQDDRPAFAVTDADGHYELQTYFAPGDVVPGAVPSDYSVIIEKRRAPELSRVLLKIRDIVRAVGRGPHLDRYLMEQSSNDMWPDGVPEGWVPGYVPSIKALPKKLREDMEVHKRLDYLMTGYHLLPELYAELETSPFKAEVDRSKEEWSFDFDLEGPPPIAAPSKSVTVKTRKDF